MMKRSRTRRIQGLVATFLAILGLAALLRSSAAYLERSSSHARNTPKSPGSVEVDGVEYRPLRRVSPRKDGYGQTYRATVEACQPVGGERIWEVTIREGTYPAGGRGMLSLMDPRHDPDASVSPERFLDRFALKLAVKGRGILATTPDGGEYLVDPGTRQVRQVKTPSPPKRPIMDARLPGKTRCEVHDRKLIEGVVPIRYGFGMVQRAAYEARRTRFPYAVSSYGGGCVVGESREARVFYCPDCRDAERAWSKEPPVEPADDKD